ncbi:Rpr2-domain-containing protein [Viridothelium virens]|uniref:Rpr2-domain-containing protein n=1 Tax=Viridothelium virens TaxID=1048519 RepID=A0A6A6HK86_VIRVR|nr:Rpr2-domain-containing protein [Viridothelium virens]
MAKKKTIKRVSNPHLHARVSYLYQAVNYLFPRQSNVPQVAITTGDGHPLHPRNHDKVGEQDGCSAQIKQLPKADDQTSQGILDKGRDGSGLSRHLITHIRATALKAQVRLSHQMKHSLCKHCDTLLVPETTSCCFQENRSKGKKKPWADVHVIECLNCGTQKRFPVGSKRQAKGRPKKTGIAEHHEPNGPILEAIVQGPV